MPLTEQYAPDFCFGKLADEFGDIVNPANFPELKIRFRHHELSKKLGFDQLSETEWIRYFAKFEMLPGQEKGCIAQRYHGHQFRNYNPDIGDGRGFTFAWLRSNENHRIELGTKGSGQTPYSRFGDGRLTLKGGVRELIAARYLEFLGVPTSCALSLIETGEQLERHDEPSPTRSAVLVRAQSTHIRFGTFQYHTFHQNFDYIERLIDYYLEHLTNPAERELINKNSDKFAKEKPTCIGGTLEQKMLIFFNIVVERTAKLAAHWMVAGFAHGVLNTDNFAISGESFDYGPWRVLQHYDLSFTAAYFDHSGLYCYGRQAEACFWALQQLAISLRSLCKDDDQLIETLNNFSTIYDRAYRKLFLKRLGVVGRVSDGEADQLVDACLKYLKKSKIAYATLFETALDLDQPKSKELDKLRNLIKKFNLQETSEQALRKSTSSPIAPTISVVEDLWAHIDKNDNWDPLNQYLDALDVIFQ